MRSFYSLFLAIFVTVVFSATPARAELSVDITQGSMNSIPIAIPNFVGGNYGAQVTKVITDDLERSSLFRGLNPNSFIQQFSSSADLPRFPDWKAINAQLLVVGSVSQVGSNLSVDFRLYDVLSQKQMTGFSYQTPVANWRRIAHLVADAIYERVTGEKGYFDTRIVYVAETGSRARQTKRLAIMDQDGFNQRYLTDGRALVLTPRFSPNSPTITYLGYYNRTPQVYMLHVDTGRVETLGSFPGMTFAPRFSPDGNNIVFSMARGGNTDIFVMNLRSKRVQRLTNHPSIDTSPSYSPDGSQIVFNSDRGGSQQLYTMDANGGSVQRISFGEGRYSTPVWSPRGDLIAFTKSKGGQFSIGVMRTDGSSERILSSSFLDEGPTWAPNGRVLMFFRETPGYGTGGVGKKSQLYSVDLTGYNLRQIRTPTEASDPAWSALNPNY